jgi:hypothetical protein
MVRLIEPVKSLACPAQGDYFRLFEQAKDKTLCRPALPNHLPWGGWESLPQFKVSKAPLNHPFRMIFIESGMGLEGTN